jgi:glycosyltransferase involved in cell wall biosynthesis
MIKVLRIINRFNLGGPTFNAALLTRYLPEEFETTLIGGVPDEGETDSLHILEKYGVTPIILPELIRNPNVTSDRRAYLKIKELIKELQPDIVHTHASKAGLIGRQAAISAGVKTIVHTYHGHVFHSYFNQPKTFAIKKIERHLAKRSSGIIAISETQKQELVTLHKIAPEEKVKVIPLGFDLSEFLTDNRAARNQVRKEYGIEDHEVAIAIVGRLAPVKNHIFFLQVIKRLLQKIDHVKVLIVGDGLTRNEIAPMVDEINVQYGHKIKMTSWIFDIANFNKGMDIMCLTSDNEGTPVSLIEAQASALPVVSTDVGGVRDIVLDNESGFIINKGDIETYIEKLRLLVENYELRVKFAQTGRDFVKERFGYHRLISDMSSYYKELLNKHV